MDKLMGFGNGEEGMIEIDDEEFTCEVVAEDSFEDELDTLCRKYDKKNFVGIYQVGTTVALMRTCNDGLALTLVEMADSYLRGNNE